MADEPQSGGPRRQISMAQKAAQETKEAAAAITESATSVVADMDALRDRLAARTPRRSRREREAEE